MDPLQVGILVFFAIIVIAVAAWARYSPADEVEDEDQTLNTRGPD